MWTLETFKVLESIGERLGFRSRYKGKREFLWDFVWLEMNDEVESFGQLFLAAESEWTHRNVVDDFNKLLVTAAPLRLMIFQAQYRDMYKEKLEDLKSRSYRFKNNPGFFIVACWIYGEEKKEVMFNTWNTFLSEISNKKLES